MLCFFFFVLSIDFFCSNLFFWSFLPYDMAIHWYGVLSHSSLTNRYIECLSQYFLSDHYLNLAGTTFLCCVHIRYLPADLDFLTTHDDLAVHEPFRRPAAFPMSEWLTAFPSFGLHRGLDLFYSRWITGALSKFFVNFGTRKNDKERQNEGFERLSLY